VMVFQSDNIGQNWGEKQNIVGRIKFYFPLRPIRCAGTGLSPVGENWDLH